MSGEFNIEVLNGLRDFRPGLMGVGSRNAPLHRLTTTIERHKLFW
ncbi:hypothetical protein [Moorena sp. SIO3H5]|nr:hypothetical protein [Moorena sp. SIO3H5]